MTLGLGALGVRGALVEPGAGAGPALALEADALWVRTASEAAPGMAGARAETTRLRVGLKGTWRGLEVGGSVLQPTVEVGVRHDGGDAETGYGVDAGAGLAWRHAASGIGAELGVRGLLTHEAAGMRERGISGSLAWDPAPDSALGPSLTLTQTMGAQASGGMDALFGRETLAGLGARDDDLENRRLDLRFVYGMDVFGGRFTAAPELGFGLANGSREYRLGGLLGLARSGPESLALRVGVARRETAAEDVGPEHGIKLELTVRW